MRQGIVLLESIRIENGRPANIVYHNIRLNRARQELLGMPGDWDLGSLIDIPAGFRAGIFKCRVQYGDQVVKIEFLPYEKKTVKRLLIVKDDSIEYGWKFADRSSIDRLKSRAGPDEDIIIVKHGLVTDSSAANLVFESPNGRLLTPSAPLLEGTCRARLLGTGRIRTAEIRPADLKSFSRIHLVNAMLDLGKQTVEVSEKTLAG